MTMWCQPETTPQTWPGELAIVTSYFNPKHDSRIEQNFRRFVRALGVPVLTAELSFEDRFVSDWGLHFQADLSHLLWQKERLLNLALRSLPECYTKIAWIDADVLLLNPHWYHQACQMLDHFDVMQLFTRALWLDSQGRIEKSRPSWCSLPESRQCLTSRGGQPGLAWAARRDALPQRLFDLDVVGNNDEWMLYAFLGHRSGPLNQITSPSLAAEFTRWADATVKNGPLRRVALQGDCIHMYHGSISSREYVLRNRILRESNYDPGLDIRTDRHGLLQLTNIKSDLAVHLHDYFARRAVAQ